MTARKKKNTLLSAAKKRGPASGVLAESSLSKPKARMVWIVGLYREDDTMLWTHGSWHASYSEAVQERGGCASYRFLLKATVELP